MFSIEDGILCPPAPRPRGRKAKYPFKEMRPGQSFFVPAEKSGVMARTCAYFKKRLPFDFLVRSWKEGDVQGVRVFCVAKDEKPTIRAVG